MVDKHQDIFWAVCLIYTGGPTCVLSRHIRLEWRLICSTLCSYTKWRYSKARNRCELSTWPHWPQYRLHHRLYLTLHHWYWMRQARPNTKPADAESTLGMTCCAVSSFKPYSYLNDCFKSRRCTTYKIAFLQILQHSFALQRPLQMQFATHVPKEQFWIWKKI